MEPREPQVPSSPSKGMEMCFLRTMTLESTLGQLSLHPAGTDDYSKQFIGLKGSILAALNEMTVEVWHLRCFSLSFNIN
jgi:hypothetical protein